MKTKKSKMEYGCKPIENIASFKKMDDVLIDNERNKKFKLKKM